MRLRGRSDAAPSLSPALSLAVPRDDERRGASSSRSAAGSAGSAVVARGRRVPRERGRSDSVRSDSDRSARGRRARGAASPASPLDDELSSSRERLPRRGGASSSPKSTSRSVNAASSQEKSNSGSGDVVLFRAIPIPLQTKTLKAHFSVSPPEPKPVSLRAHLAAEMALASGPLILLVILLDH